MLKIYSLPDLIFKMHEDKWHPKFVFFWSHESKGEQQIGNWCLSQWYPSTFVLDGIEYATAEHYYMAEKARLFNDDATLSKILESSHPGAAKKLGRLVQGFDIEIWETHRFSVVVRGNVAKFGQNKELQQYLLTTSQRVLVEASPRDKIWGIGLSADHDDVQYPEKWQGLNLLGFALMKARAELTE